MRKPKDWGQPCPKPDCTHYRLMNRGNISAISTYMTQSGKRRIFLCNACETMFSETRVVYLGAAGNSDGPVRSRSRRVNRPALAS